MRSPGEFCSICYCISTCFLVQTYNSSIMFMNSVSVGRKIMYVVRSPAIDEY